MLCPELVIDELERTEGVLRKNYGLTGGIYLEAEALFKKALTAYGQRNSIRRSRSLKITLTGCRPMRGL